MKIGKIFGIAIAASFALAAVVIVQSPAIAAHHEKGEAHTKMGEHRAQMMAKFEEHLKEVDSNGDGVVTKDEADAAHQAHFGKSDTDNDGTISYEEFEVKAIERAREHAKKMFAHMDKDEDGNINAEEFSSRSAGKFDKMDVDGDGKVTKEEMNAHHKSHGGKKHH